MDTAGRAAFVVDKGRAIRVPVHMAEKNRKVSRAYGELCVELGREPAEEEVAELLGWESEEVRTAMGAAADVTSLNKPFDSERGTAVELGDLVADERAPDAAEVVTKEIETQELWAAVERLPERERRVLVRRYALDGRKEATLAELARELDISKERVRQLQKGVIKLLERREHGRLLRQAAAT